jgi:hypothetical protein
MKTNARIQRRDIIVLALVVLVCVPTGLAQKSKKGEDQTNRTVQGIVTSPEDAPVGGAVVQLKNTKTLQIRSFITKEDGSYYFNGLSPDVDFELRAENQGSSSSTKTVSSFDSRKTVTINLKLNKK